MVAPNERTNTYVTLTIIGTEPGFRLSIFNYYYLLHKSFCAHLRLKTFCNENSLIALIKK